MFLLHQTIALTKKSLLLLVARKPFSTFFRSLLFPLVIIILLSYAKELFYKEGHYGVSPATPILSLEDAFELDNARNVVAFIDSGLKGGAVATAIQTLSDRIKAAGKSIQIFQDRKSLYEFCDGGAKGMSSCFAGVEIRSSPSEPNDGGAWNYTILTDPISRRNVNIFSIANDVQIYVLPLQRQLDAVMANLTSSQDTIILQQLYAAAPRGNPRDDARKQYLDTIISYIGILFILSMAEVSYHLPGHIALEREAGMAQLIDAMMPTSSPWMSQFARLMSAQWSFSVVYAPGWLGVGIVLATVVFTTSSAAIPILYHLLCGLALVTFSTLGGVFFKRPHLSGVLVLIITLVMAVVPQVVSSYKQTDRMVIALSLLFPSSNYIYFIIAMARFEYNSIKTNLLKNPPPATFEWEVKPIFFIIFLILQILIYPILAMVVERVLFGTVSPGRKVASDREDETITLQLRNFTKIYKRQLRIFGKNKGDVHAVTDLSLNAHRGQILTLLGPNGSGKSTTMNAIAGLSKLSSGFIDIYSSTGVGIAPQANVIWNDLTVEEHIRIFVTLKTTQSVDVQVETDKLIASCDLENKRYAKSKTLSGGQKRKLQLAMMFAGGSGVCCVDEVSSGLDPLSRRKVWDILLAERHRRTIILTTHFLDEADFLADNIAILAKGKLAAQGSAAELKQRLGNGYTVMVSSQLNAILPAENEFIVKEEFQGMTTYRIANSSHVSEFIENLEKAGITDYNISGPTIEELFLKIAGDDSTKDSTAIRDDQDSVASLVQPTSRLDLQKGRHLSTLAQVWILFRKRTTVLRHRYMPYLSAIGLALIGAGVTPLLLKDMEGRLECRTLDSGRDFSTALYIWDQSINEMTESTMVIGPSSKITNQAMERVADVYSSRRNKYPQYYGFKNVSEVQRMFHIVDSVEEFNAYLSENLGSIYPGGFYLSDPPVLATGPQSSYGLMVQNLLSIMQNDVKISASIAQFDLPPSPAMIDFPSLLFMFYFGVICIIYPAFFTLYPTAERLNNLREMQYSNGVRPLALWLSHLAFDGIFVVLITTLSVILLSASISSVWYYLALVWVVLVLYGFTSTLLGYVLSLFAPSVLSAWAFSFLGQLVMLGAIYGGTIGALASVDNPDATGKYNSMSRKGDSIYFSIGLISPIANLFRALATSLGQFGQNCREKWNPGDIRLYGGPIAYLVVQALVLILFLFWYENSSINAMTASLKRINLRTTTKEGDIELVAGAQHRNTGGLEVTNLSKRFGKHLVLDDVSFSVKPSTTFALLGPNGAGKSTAISLIRGDITPSSSQSDIAVAGISPLTNRSHARAHLGVCPQFDSVDILTVKQMLSFYARIRGVSEVEHDVSVVMTACGIQSYANRLTGKLSGGTKRKLSLAIALLGNPYVLLLDEPSSGLDAAAKRILWRTLQAVSSDRAVVLTTHSMEEAEAVCSVVGILSGRMLAVGPTEEIKRQGGGGEFYIHLEAANGHLTTPEQACSIKEFVLSTFPNAVIERDMVAGQIRFHIQPEPGTSMASLFAVLEKSKSKLGLSCYSVGRPTLDQVFVNIVTQHGGKEENHNQSQKSKWWNVR